MAQKFACFTDDLSSLGGHKCKPLGQVHPACLSREREHTLGKNSIDCMVLVKFEIHQRAQVSCLQHIITLQCIATIRWTSSWLTLGYYHGICRLFYCGAG